QGWFFLSFPGVLLFLRRRDFLDFFHDFRVLNDIYHFGVLDLLHDLGIFNELHDLRVVDDLHHLRVAHVFNHLEILLNGNKSLIYIYRSRLFLNGHGLERSFFGLSLRGSLQSFAGACTQLILHGEMDWPDSQAIARVDNVFIGDPLLIQKGAVDAVQVLDGEVAVLKLEQAMPPADLGRRDAQIAIAAPANDGRFMAELDSLAAGGTLTHKQLNVHG